MFNNNLKLDIFVDKALIPYISSVPIPSQWKISIPKMVVHKNCVLFLQIDNTKRFLPLSPTDGAYAEFGVSVVDGGSVGKIM